MQSAAVTKLGDTEREQQQQKKKSLVITTQRNNNYKNRKFLLDTESHFLSLPLPQACKAWLVP